ncbi:TonB-dependent receptor [Pontibacter sp. SGAir0037]|uniref:TonB-dependent receptor n=1 Tax=Pontibacter sp. SGAir0037 TaxID=2571030 RepID=UPI0010CCD90D|nr:TonB-dependent receptor [Pontibacter sp. SGAir0037]QCR21631.1 TonB-dependent receptor [Pontibacter sp. SGAir0037]
MKELSLLLLLVLLLPVAAMAHLEGSITGTVVQEGTLAPLQGVSISLKDPARTAQTDALGRYRFDNLAAGANTLEVAHLGFARQVVAVMVQEDQTTALRITLLAAPVALSEVNITAQQPEEQQLLSSLDMQLRPIRNSQEMLRLVPGLFIGQHAGGGKAEQIFLRGFDLDHGTDIRLSVDGMPVNMVSHAHGQGYADLHFVIPELVQAVDFGKGPYHAEQGNLATAGYVNLRTRTSLDSSMVKLELGQYDTYRAVGLFNLLGQRGKEKQQSAYLASEYSFTNGYFDNPQHFNRLNLLGKYHTHLSPTTRFTLTASTFYSRWNHSGQIPDRAVASGLIGFFGSIDPNEGGETSRSNLNAELVTVTPGNNVIKHQLFYSNYNFELYSNFTFFLEDPENGDQIRQKEGRHLFGYNGSFTNNSTLGSKALSSTIGLNYRHDVTSGSELSHSLNRTQTLEQYQLGNINELNAGLYVEETLQISPRFTASAGARLDVFRNQYEDLLQSPATTAVATAAIVSPKLNLTYTPSTQLQLYLKSGKGFHSNDTRVVVPQQGREILPAAYGSDLGFIWKPVPRLLLNVAAWYLWLEQEFVYVGDAGVVEPSGQSRRRGLDLSARYQLNRYLYADLDVSAARPQALGEAEGENYLPLAPTFTSVGGLSLQQWKRFSGSLRYRYMADRPANEDNSIVAEGYFVSDLQVNYSYSRHQLGLSVENLFNTRWKETQFATESRLQYEARPVEEIHFTPGAPFYARLSWAYKW